MELLDLLKERHSVKAFSDKKVNEEDLEKIITAGLYAPSGMNKQCVRLLVVTNLDVIKQISILNASVMNRSIDPFYNCQALIVVFADRNVSTHVEDGSLALGNMLNEAFSLGVDSCWVHRAKETFELEAARKIASMYGIGDEFIGIGNCVLGYRALSFSKKDRIPNRVFYVK